MTAGSRINMRKSFVFCGLYSKSIAPRRRGARIETLHGSLHQRSRIRIAPRRRGARIETGPSWPCGCRRPASPLGDGGRGLKLPIPARELPLRPGIAPRRRGARIETHFTTHGTQRRRASPLGDGGRGLKPAMRWLVGLNQIASPLGDGGRGLKLSANGLPNSAPVHRPSATGGAD